MIFTALPALERLERLRAVTAPLGRMIFDRYHSKVIARTDTHKILTVDELCTGCATCAATCHFDAISVDGDDWDYERSECMGCELCVERCPEQALSLYRDPAKSLPLDLDMVRDELADGS